MKKIKRILAAIGAVLLIGMYASTLIFALIDHSATKGLLKASIACTIILPVLLYAYTLVYKLTRGDQKDDRNSSSEDPAKKDQDTIKTDQTPEKEMNQEESDSRD